MDNLPEQLHMLTTNYHRFTLEVVRLVNEEVSEARLKALYQTACHYQRLFAELSTEEEHFSPQYLDMSNRLAKTLAHLLGIDGPQTL